MEHKKWERWELIGLFLTIAAGNLLHFVYDWSGGSPVAAVLSAVNESVWEHMKLLAVPWLVWTVVELAALRGVAGLLSARTAGLVTGLLLIPALYYTYTGALGSNSSLVNILIFQLAVLAAFAVTRCVKRSGLLCGALWQILAALLLAVLAVLFFRWTFEPPQAPLFVDPVTGLAGIA